jgi:hypothetical protein
MTNEKSDKDVFISYSEWSLHNTVEYIPSQDGPNSSDNGTDHLPYLRKQHQSSRVTGEDVVQHRVHLPQQVIPAHARSSLSALNT